MVSPAARRAAEVVWNHDHRVLQVAGTQLFAEIRRRVADRRAVALQEVDEGRRSGGVGDDDFSPCAALSSALDTKLAISSSETGPASSELTSTTIHVRRSRSASLSSLRKTTAAALTCLRDGMRNVFVIRQRHERVLQRGCAGLAPDLVAAALRDAAPVRNDDDAVGELLDLRHDVR